MSEPIPPTAQDRLLAAIRALIRSEMPQQTYLGTYAYVVESSDGQTVDAYPEDTTIALPPIKGVPLRSGVAGITHTPAKGTRVAFRFLNGDPSRPLVDGAFDGTTAQQININGSSPAAARTGDSVTVGYVVLDSTGAPSSGWTAGSPFSGVVYPGNTLGLAAAAAAAAGLTPPGTVFPLIGSISGGSSTVNIGG